MTHIQHLDIKLLKPNDSNPRRIDDNQFEKLVANIQRDPGFFERRPCLVTLQDDGSYSIYAGNQRYRAAKRLKWKKVPCIVDEQIDEEVIKRRIVLDNIHHGENDWDILSSLYDMNELIELGMTPKELHLDMDSGTEDKEQKECDRCPECNQKLKKKK